jgi:hypothetical protein
MSLDVRLPIGVLFSFLGAALAVFGIFSDRDIYRVSLDINVNLGWGLALLVFGLTMLAFGWNKGRQGERSESKR